MTEDTEDEIPHPPGQLGGQAHLRVEPGQDPSTPFS